MYSPFQWHLRQLFTAVEVNGDIDIGNILQHLLIQNKRRKIKYFTAQLTEQNHGKG